MQHGATRNNYSEKLLPRPPILTQQTMQPSIGRLRLLAGAPHAIGLTDPGVLGGEAADILVGAAVIGLAAAGFEAQVVGGVRRVRGRCRCG